METRTNANWYDNETLVDTLLFVFPPIGIYGAYKTNMIKSKITKVFYSGIGFISILLGIIYIIKQ